MQTEVPALRHYQNKIFLLKRVPKNFFGRIQKFRNVYFCSKMIKSCDYVKSYVIINIWLESLFFQLYNFFK